MPRMRALPPAPPAPAAPITKIGQMYGRWTLDCVNEAAYAVALDYEKRYRHYRDVDAAVGVILSDLRSRIGSDPRWPNAAQRSAINVPLIGISDAKSTNDRTSTIQEAGRTLRQAATTYSERVYDTGEPMLRQAFFDAAKNFRACLTTLVGNVVEVGNRHTLAIFEKSVNVLSSDAVAQAFGIPAAPPAPWPLNGQLDGGGAYLIEEITRTLATPVSPVSQGQFMALQRVASNGALVAAEIEDDWHLDVNLCLLLIGNAYAWATALRSLTK
ncbi:MAG: hypothetical protein ABIU05_06970 [Nitrospirales bacterium]